MENLPNDGSTVGAGSRVRQTRSSSSNRPQNPVQERVFAKLAAEVENSDLTDIKNSLPQAMDEGDKNLAAALVVAMAKRDAMLAGIQQLEQEQKTARDRERHSFEADQQSMRQMSYREHQDALQEIGHTYRPQIEALKTKVEGANEVVSALTETYEALGKNAVVLATEQYLQNNSKKQR